MTATIADHAAAGAVLLDEHKPGWHDRIDICRLDMMSPRECVLGQMYGWYFDGLRMLGIEFGSYEEIRAGFNVASEDDKLALTEAWRELILQRRAEVSS